MTETLLAFANAQMQAAQRIVARGEELMPVLVVEGGDQPAIIGVPQYGNHDAKPFLRAKLSAFLKQHNARRYAFVMEAWLGKKSISDALPEGYAPSKDPERLEAIVVNAVQEDGMKVFIISEIRRIEGKITFEEPTTMDSALGALSELFGPGLPN